MVSPAEMLTWRKGVSTPSDAEVTILNTLSCNGYSSRDTCFELPLAIAFLDSGCGAAPYLQNVMWHV